MSRSSPPLQEASEASPPEPTGEQPVLALSKRVQLELDILHSEFDAAYERSRGAEDPAATEQ